MGGCCGGPASVLVEIEYLAVEGETCERCGDTRGAARQAVADARVLLGSRGLEVELVERPLDAARLADSNRVLVNGLPAEEWLGGSSAQSDCPSCADLIGAAACCREVEVGGVRTEAIPREVVFDAIMAAAGLAPAGMPGEACCGARVPHVTLVTGPGCG